MPQPLPPNTFAANTPAWNAYNSCVDLEAMGSWDAFVEDLNARIGNPSLEVFMFHNPPEVAGEVNACNGTLRASPAWHISTSTVSFEFNPTGPAITADQSPDLTFDQQTNVHRNSLNTPGAQPTLLRKKLLHRDQYRCVLTGRIDRASLDKAEETPELFFDLAPLVAPQAPPSLTDGIGGLSQAVRAKLDWASSASAILGRFSGIDIKRLLGGTDLHSAINSFMASNEAHALFDRLHFCLIPSKDAQDQIVSNTYDVLYLYRRRNGNIRQRVTFTERVLNGKTTPPPSSVLLGLHAACARIAHMSGAAAILDDFDRDNPPTAVLTQGFSDKRPDPVAAQDLARALSHLAVVRPVPVY
ncbi:hypothetical protein C8R44DRAFT_865256 [Mycena epipterygia]|nr:hypothetical protein C8R44DRAFT_865256 [Mycena epipterygia]